MNKYENIIIGAGPAGLQLGYFFQKANINYIIIEKGSKAASFFNKYPHSGTLISINKKYTGSDDSEFNLRHDWNSLLNDEKLLFTNYSDEYYPDSKDLVRYFNDFAIKNKLNIIYESTVNKVNKNEKIYELEVNCNEKIIQYSCDKLIVATGLSKFIKPDYTYNVKDPILHYGEYPKNYFKKKDNLEKFKNKSLLIIGGGNSAFELGNHLNKYCSTITILGRNIKPWAMSTHYTGDLRSIYIPLMDTFLLKSLNAITNEKRFTYLFEQENINEPYIIKCKCLSQCEDIHDFQIAESKNAVFDNVILCTGWGFDNNIFNFDVATTIMDKYPAITSNFESVNNENLYFIGSLMHSLDYKKSSGGFIHGFRYLIKHFFDFNYKKTFDIMKHSTFDELVDHMLLKINTSSALYQMYGKLSDIFFIEDDGIIYFNNVPNDFHETIISPVIDKFYFVLTLEYGNEPIKTISELGKKVSYLGFENKSPLLHLVIRIYQYTSSNIMFKIDEVHFDEDLYSEFTNDIKYKHKIIRTIKMFL
jgi:thioredoxin reductase